MLNQTTLAETLIAAAAFVCERDPTDISLDSSLVDLGIDSLVASQMLIEAELRLGVELDFELLETLDGLTTLKDVRDALETSEVMLAVQRADRA